MAARNQGCLPCSSGSTGPALSRPRRGEPTGGLHVLLVSRNEIRTVSPRGIAIARFGECLWVHYNAAGLSRYGRENLTVANLRFWPAA